MHAETPRDLFIGIDLGTSGCRAIAIDRDARVLAEARATLSPPQRQGSAVEQSPALWWLAVQAVLRYLVHRIDPQRVVALAVDGTSGTVLHCNAQGHVLGPALMYNDARALTEAERIRCIAPAETAAHGPSATLAKLLWLQAHRPAPHPHQTLHQADWLTGCLNGRYDTTDTNNALKLGYDPLSGAWPDWLDTLGVDRTSLPGVVAPGTPLAPLLTEVATALGLPRDVLVVAGTTDSTAAFLATGVCRTGDAVTSLGSTLVLKIIADQPVFAPQYGVYSQPLPECDTANRVETAPMTTVQGSEPAHVSTAGKRMRPTAATPLILQRWLVGGSSNTGGAVLRRFFNDADLVQLSARMQPDIPTGLDYYPLPAPGERFPTCNPDLAPRLTPRPDDDTRFLQGMLEGMAQIEQTGYVLLARLGASYPGAVCTVGGGATNPAWTRLRARQLDIPLLSARHQEAAYGAALLARTGYTRNRSPGPGA